MWGHEGQQVDCGRLRLGQHGRRQAGSIRFSPRRRSHVFVSEACQRPCPAFLLLALLLVSLFAAPTGVKNLVEKGYKKISPFFIPYAITNMGGALLAIDTGFMGPNYSISTACATANYAFVSAANHIRNGEADLMIVGGSEAPIIPVGLGGFVACRALSTRNDEPQKASRCVDTLVVSGGWALGGRGGEVAEGTGSNGRPGTCWRATHSAGWRHVSRHAETKTSSSLQTFWQYVPSVAALLLSPPLVCCRHVACTCACFSRRVPQAMGRRP